MNGILRNWKILPAPSEKDLPLAFDFLYARNIWHSIFGHQILLKFICQCMKGTNTTSDRFFPHYCIPEYGRLAPK